MSKQTRYKELEQQIEVLEENETFLKGVLKASQIGIVYTNERKIVWVNETLKELFGFDSPEDYTGMDTSEFFISNDEYDRIGQLVFEQKKNEEIVHYDTVFVRKDRSHFNAHVRVNLFDVSDVNRGVITSMIDITDRKKTELALMKSERNYRQIFDATSDAIFIHDGKTGEILDANARMISMYGYNKEETLGMTADQFSSGIPPYDQTNALRKIDQAKKAGAQMFEWQAKKKSGEFFWVEVNLRFSKIAEEERFIAVVRDITERKKTHEIMIQTEKMLSVGGLAAGMAHELNNPLGGMLQGAQNVLRRLSSDLRANIDVAGETGIDLQNLQNYLEKRQIFSSLNGIQASGKKAANIISNMLKFSRKSESTMRPADLAGLIRSTVELARTDYNLKKQYDFRNITITEEFDSHLLPVTCIEIEIEQVILNLLGNSAYAMANNVKGIQSLIILRLINEGKRVRIEVEDNGHGMNEETRHRIFDPFYTTKPEGEGTGLGLSVSYMIITNNHNGTIEVESEPGKGTKFIIKLPLIQE